MRWTPRSHLPIVVGGALLVAAVGLVLPWWSVEAGGVGPQTEFTVSPFSPGPADSLVKEGAVTAVGVLDMVGLVGLVGGIVLWLRGRNSPAEELDLAAWVWLAAGGFLLVAALTAVITWPEEGMSFWGSGGAGMVDAAASTGWYLTLVAGAMGSVAGMAWLVRRTPPPSQAEGAQATSVE